MVKGQGPWSWKSHLYIRARWIWFKGIRLLKIKTGHMYSYVKLNCKARLFSCIFWFEAILRCKTALLVFWPSNWENGSKTVQKKSTFWKLAQNPPKSDKRIKQTCNPPFWGDVGIKKWSRFFCFGIRSAIFWHLKTGTFGGFWANFQNLLFLDSFGAIFPAWRPKN